MWRFFVTINLLLLSSVSHTAPAFMETLIKGRVVVDGGYYRLRPDGTNRTLTILTGESVVRSRLGCLKNGDFLSGTASAMSEHSVTLRSIDYVGLKDLFGTWRNQYEVFKFEDFRNFFYWNFLRVPASNQGPFAYHYALSPFGESKQQCLWKIFIIDNSGVTMGSLEWAAEDQIYLQIYDPDSGEVSSSKHLLRSVN